MPSVESLPPKDVLGVRTSGTAAGTEHGLSAAPPHDEIIHFIFILFMRFETRLLNIKWVTYFAMSLPATG